METINKNILKNISPDLANRFRLIPHVLNGDILTCFTDRLDSSNNKQLEIFIGKKIETKVCSSEDLDKLLATHYPVSFQKKESKQNQKRLSAQEDFILTLIEEAQLLQSSDIHLEKYDKSCRVRMRINGNLVERYSIKNAEYPSLINKIKIRANLDIAEKRLPQDGRIKYQSKNMEFDIRVSVLPTLYGEKAVLRLLVKNDRLLQIDQLGFDPTQLKQYQEGIRNHNGIILISGPTGSGKTTSLYATLKELNKTKSNILTIEDPIEYTLDGINQVQLKESIGLNFSSAMRTFLRQDPDIIMVGEIRDADTAQMAIRAALTGHLVFSTIHTNSAWGTVSRLLDMNIPSYLIASTLKLSMAQRLVAILCDNCKTPSPFNEKEFPQSFTPPKEVHTQFTAKGCKSCSFTGVQGRQAIYELIPISGDIAKAIKRSELLDGQPIEENHCLLEEKAFELFEQGKVSLEEIFPILMSTK